MPRLTNPASSSTVVTGVAASVAALSPYVSCEADSLAGADGDAITTWDNPGSLADLTAAGAGKPLLRLGDRGINSCAALEFDGTDDFFTVPALNALADGTIIAVLRSTLDPPTVARGLWKIGTDGVDGDLYPFTDRGLYIGAGRSARVGITNAHGNVAMSRILTVSSATNNWRVYLDGAQINIQGTSTVGFTATPFLGKNVQTQYWAGRIAAFYVFPLLSVANQQLVENVLRVKYGTPA